ncbi:UNVERIFIED_CONTAM: hypothetical protein RMT77_002055 [Armadillidium vulgare]
MIRKLSDNNKNRIREAIRQTQKQYNVFSYLPSDKQTHEELLKKNLEELFRDETVYDSKNFGPSQICPDIYIKKLCVGEVKYRRRSNLNASDWNQPMKYVKRFQVPGFLVLFDHDEKEEPLVRWYYYDDSQEMAVKEEYPEVERVASNIVYYQEALQACKSSDSGEGLSFGAGLAIGAAAVGVGALVAGLFSINRNRKE